MLPVGQFLASSENQKQVQGSQFFPHFLQVPLLNPKIEKQILLLEIGFHFDFSCKAGTFYFFSFFLPLPQERAHQAPTAQPTLPG